MQADLHRRHKVSYDVPLKLRNFILYCLVRVLFVLCDTYIMCQESPYVGYLDNPHKLHQQMAQMMVLL